MSHSNDIGTVLPSIVSIGVGTDSTLGIMEKVDKAIQTDKFKTISLDPCTTKEE